MSTFQPSHLSRKNSDLPGLPAGAQEILDALSPGRKINTQIPQTPEQVLEERIKVLNAVEEAQRKKKRAEQMKIAVPLVAVAALAGAYSLGKRGRARRNTGIFSMPKSRSGKIFRIGAWTTAAGVAIAGPVDEAVLLPLTGGLSAALSPIQGALGVGLGGLLGLVGIGLMVGSQWVADK